MRFLIWIIVALAPAFGASGQFLFLETKPTFSIIQWGDLHAGTSAQYVSNYQATADFIVNHKTAWNISIVVSPGDCFEEVDDNVSLGSDGFKRSDMTNIFGLFRSNGISVFNLPGNHESDTVGPVYWTNVFPIAWYQADPAFIGVRSNSDTRDVIMAITNRDMKFLFVGERWIGGAGSTPFESESDVEPAYRPYNSWITNVAAQYPRHYLIHVTHYMLDTNGVFNTTQDFSSYVNLGPSKTAWDGYLDRTPNFLFGISAHTRLAMTTHLQTNSVFGNQVNFVQFNTQVPGRCGGWANGTAFKRYIVDPNQMTITAETYHVPLGRYLTNGEFGYTHEFTFPIQRLR